MRLDNKDPKVRPEEMDAPADAEQRLQKIAAERRAGYEASPQVILKKLEEFAHQTLPKEHSDTLEKTQTAITTVARDGKISTQVMTGMPGDGFPPDSIVKSNHKSVRSRANRIRQIREEVILLISMIKDRKSPPPGNVDNWIEELIATIPAIGPMEIIQDSTT